MHPPFQDRKIRSTLDTFIKNIDGLILIHEFSDKLLNSTDIVRFSFKSEKSELNIVFAVNIFITDGMILLREKDYPRKGNDGYKKRKKKKKFFHKILGT